MHRVSHGGHRSLRPASIVIAVLSTLLLSGCADSDFSLTAEDAVGTWRAGSNLPTQLELVEGGVFTVTDWPLNLRCRGGSPRTVKALQGSETVDFAGTWEEGETGSLNALTLYPDGEACPISSITAQFRSESGVKYTCLSLGVPNELSNAENFFILYLGEPHETPKSSACFSYN